MSSLFLRAMQGIAGLSILATLSAPLPAVQAQLGKTTTLGSLGGEAKAKSHLEKILLEEMTKKFNETQKVEASRESKKSHFYIKGTNNSLIAFVDVEKPSFLSLFYFNWSGLRKKIIKDAKDGLDLVKSLSNGGAQGISLSLEKGGSQTLGVFPFWIRSGGWKDGEVLRPEGDCKFTKITEKKVNPKVSHKLTCSSKTKSEGVHIQDVSDDEI